MQIKCATYNILHGHHRDQILANIRFLIDKGVDVLCLQETEEFFEQILQDFLNKENLNYWKVEYAHPGMGGNVAMAWNSNKLVLRDSKILKLPTLGGPVFLQRLAGHNITLQRAGLVCSFEIEGRTLQVATVHLAWEGGTKHRLRQIAYLKDFLDQYPANSTIIAGDFNTNAPSLFRRFGQRRIEAALGREYTNAHPDLVWSCDISYADPQDKMQILQILKYLGIYLRTRLDYIFVRNMSVVQADMYDLPGSDHRPLIATFNS